MGLNQNKKSLKFNRIFLSYFIFFSMIFNSSFGFSWPGFNSNSNQCEAVFTDNLNDKAQTEYSKSPEQKPPVSRFLRSERFKKILQNISQRWPSDTPRILVAKFRNSNFARYSASGLFTLFLMISPTTAHSQQSLFNAPSIEATEKHKFFFQEQVNLLPQEGVFNTTLDYGLGDGWSVGMSLFNIRAYTPDTNYIDPDTLANIEKSIKINEHWKIGFGTQSGFNLGHNPDKYAQFKSFSYFQNMFVLPKNLGKFYAGYYHANAGFTGDTSTDGAMLGVEIPIVKDKLTFMADYLSGTSPISVAVIGLVWQTKSQWQLSLGAQVPSPGSGNDFGVVLEFTKPTL